VKLIGKTEITTIDEPDQLQFAVVSQSGWIDLLGIPLVSIVFAAVASISGHPFLALYSALILVAILAKAIMNYPDGSVIKLFVSQCELIARGDLGRTFADEVKAKSADVKSLGYQMGGKNSPSGLYADQGWLKQTCLFPGLNKQQANDIADTICRKFPNIKRSA
jgi:hypothetical protein